MDALASPTRLADLTGPLAPVGDLPPDLLKAFNGAVLLATHADSIRTATDALPIVAAMNAIVAGWNEAKAAILAVCHDLSATRDTPPRAARFGEIVEANAHLVALAYAWKVEAEVWQAADLARWCLLKPDSDQRMDSSVISSRLFEIRARFCRLILPSGQEIIADASGEASLAAIARYLPVGGTERPTNPNAEWCLLSGYRVRWGTEPVDLQPRLWNLLQAILNDGRDRIPFDAMDALYGDKTDGDKRLQNDLSDLNRNLEKVRWPLIYRTKNLHILTEQ